MDHGRTSLPCITGHLRAGCSQPTCGLLCHRFDSHTGVEHVGKGGQVKVDLTLDSIPAWLAGGRILPYKERPRRSTVAMAVRSCLAAAPSAGAGQPG